MKHIHGGNVYQYKNCIDFSANCNPLGTPESVKRAVKDCLEHICEYPQVGCTELKKAIGQYEGVQEDFIICGNGAAELIFTLCHTLKPQKALLQAPTFAEYEEALRSVECDCDYFYLKEEKNFSMNDEEEEERFLQKLRGGYDIVFLCNPNNPTGMLLRRDFLLRILNICKQQGIFLVVDECFLDFVKEPERYTLKAFLPDYDNLFLLKAFTKRYAIAGIRLGYGLCGSQALLEKMDSMTQPWNVSVMAQAAGIAALKEREYVQKGRELVFREAAFLKEELTKLGFKVYPCAASYIFFRGREDLFEQCVQKGILIRDCSNYEGLQQGYYRVAVRKHEDNCTLLRVLEEIERD